MDRIPIENVCFSLWILKYSFYIAFPGGLLLFIIGTDVFQGNVYLIQPPIAHYQEKNNHTQKRKHFKMMWYAPPSWVGASKSRRIGGCDLDNCEVLFDKNEFKDSDLVLFHHSNMNINPPIKKSNQTWVFVSFEVPHNTLNYYMKLKWKNKFDWTMSYRSDAEGYGPYGKIVPVRVTKKHNYTAIFLQKQKEVAWVVSHCNSQSKREKYVEKMKKFINVDVFGSCGMPCVGDCFQKIKEQYKFYLSFENSICKDYVTEKSFRIFNDGFNIVPVVRGAPNVKDLLPNNTYISTLDFKSPELLAKHLKEIGSDEAKYTEILKTKHKFISTLDIYTLGMCSLCKKLNSNFKRRENMKMEEVLNPKQCNQPNDF